MALHPFVFRFILAAAILAAPFADGVAVAQEPSGLERALAALPPDAADALRREVEQAHAQGLPSAPLVAKTLEGVAKNVPPQHIIAVVQNLSRDLARARDLLQPAVVAAPPSDADIGAVADALGRGTPPSAVRALREAAAPGEPIALAVHTLADLLDRDVPVAIALDVLGAWRARGAAPAELPDLPAAVERLVRQGLLPAQAAANVASGVRGGNSPAAIGRRGAQPPGRGRPDGAGRPPSAGPPQ